MTRYFAMGNSRYKLAITFPCFSFWLVSATTFLLGMALAIQVYAPDKGIELCIYLLLGIFSMNFLPFKYVGEKQV